MKAKVTRPFIDKVTREMYSVGSVIELTDAARLADLSSRGLVEPVAEKKVETADKTPKKKAAKKK